MGIQLQSAQKKAVGGLASWGLMPVGGTQFQPPEEYAKCTRKRHLQKLSQSQVEFYGQANARAAVLNALVPGEAWGRK